MKLFQKIFSAIAIVLCIVLVIFLRFYQLGNIPQGINVDEASYGYDAFSLLQTGKDIWGNRDTTLKSFGDYKPAGLSYTIIPFIKMFGLSTLSTRLPSALFGFFTLIVTFFLLKLLTGEKSVSLIGVIVLGLSPWHFGLSRLFYEPNIGLFFLVSSLYFQLKYLKGERHLKFLIYSAILIAAGGYYYSVLRYLGVGILSICIIIGNYQYPKKLVSQGLVVGIFWAIIAIPYLGDMFGSKGLVRLGQEGKMHEFGDVLVITENRQMCYISSGYNPIIAKFCYGLWNKPGEKLVNGIRTYIELLSPKYLFLNGYQKDVIPEKSGAFLEILLPFYLLGIYALIISIKKYLENIYILVCLLFVNIPIALAGAQNIHRNVLGLYIVFIIIIYGISYFVNLIGSKKLILKIFAYIFITSLFIWSQCRYIANYYYVFTRTQPDIWLSDSPQLMSWLAQNIHGREVYYYDFDFGPLIYSFYNKLNPVIVQKNTRWTPMNQYGWTHISSIEGLQSNRGNILKDICTLNNAGSSKLLVVNGKKDEWQEVVQFQTKNFTGIHVLHEVYDSKILYDYLNKKDPAALKATCSSQK